MSIGNRLPRVGLLLLICGIAFWWRLGYLGLIDPDEPFYAQSSREMAQAHDWVTPRIFDQPQFEKPIFIYWLSMGSFRIFGDNELGVRAPAALFATLLVFMTWAFGARVFNPRAGLLAAIVLATTTEYFVSARMILTDMVFAAFVCGAVFSLWLASRSGRRDAWFVIACAMSGLAVLTKGPLGLLIPALAALALWLAREHPLPRRFPPVAAGLAVFAAIAVPWYAIMMKEFGRTYFDAFFLHENVNRFFHAEHRNNNHFYYYPAVLIAGLVPWTPALATLFGRARRAAMWEGTPRFLILWMLLCLGFFTLAQSKLPSYVLFLFVPLALLMGRALDTLAQDGGVGRFEKWAMWALGAAQVAPFLLAPRIPTYREVAWPLGIVAACLVIALILQARRAWFAWIAVTASSALLLPVVCLARAGPAVDAIVSSRALSKEILRELRPSETLLASPILVRGVFYYTHRPVTVLSDRERPFYTPHPLPVVRSRDLSRYSVGKDGAVCAVSARDWARMEPELRRDGWVVQDTLGDKVIARSPVAIDSSRRRP